MEQEKPNIYFGIDLGTTNSVISWGYLDPKTQDFILDVIPIDMQVGANEVAKNELLPSCVYFAEDSTQIVGPFAKTMIRTQERAVVKSIKSYMGTPRRFEFHNTTYTPARISALILKMLADGAEIDLGSRPQDVVITVPASFNPDQRAATLEAAKLAGFQISDDILLDEPHAALYAFINRPNAQLLIDFTDPKLVMVFDLGGGTLDVSLHKISYGQNQNLDIGNVSTARYTQIGGDDFDKLLADHFIKDYDDKIPSSIDEIQMGLMKKAFQEYAEQAKTDLGTKFQTRTKTHGAEPDPATVTTKVLQTPYENRVFQYELTLSKYEQIIEPLLANHLNLNSVNDIDTLPFNDDNIIYPILDVLDKAKQRFGKLPQIDAVLLNGGMTRLHIIRERLRKFFGEDVHILEAGDPDKAVALGATYYHHDVASARGRYQNNPRILPDTIGLEIEEGEVIHLVEAGTRLPSQRKQYDELAAKAGAEYIKLPFYSGRRTDTKPPNRKLLEQKVHFEEPLSRDECVIIETQVDAKGILNVEGWLKTAPDRRFTAIVDSAPVSHREAYALYVSNELKTLKDKLSQYTRQHDPFKQNSIMGQIKNLESRIVNASNAEDFISPLINDVESFKETFGKQRMIILLGMLAAKPKLNKDSLYEIYEGAKELSYPEDVKKRESTYVKTVIAQAIVTIGKTKLPIAEGHLLLFLNETMPIYVRLDAIIAIGKCGQGINAIKNLRPLIQSQDYRIRTNVNWALGKIGRRERKEPPPIPIGELDSVISGLSKELQKEPHDQAKANSIYAIGEICDRRHSDLTDCVNKHTTDQVLNLLSTFQSCATLLLQQRANLAIRMIKGEKLSRAEELSLLKIRENNEKD